MAQYVMALDQGTTSSRAIIFDKKGNIICKAQNVPYVYGSKLKMNSAKPITLAVPCGKGAEYIAANKFSDAFTVVEEDLVFDVTLNQTTGGTIAYTEQAACNEIELTATPATGYKFVKWSDGDTDPTRTVAVNTDVEFSAEFELLTPTAIEQITHDQSPMTNKVLNDGMLLILRDGKMYDVLGAEVK